MTREEKQLLIKDICARIPYGIFVKECDVNDRVIYTYDYHPHIETCKPYLRPMSSMTEEEREEFRMLGGVMSYSPQHNTWAMSAFSPEAYDWLLANHFDYYGLIPMGLALEAPKDMYKTE